MIRAQRETFAGPVQILGMVIGEAGMQIRATCILDATGRGREGRGRAALIYSHVLAIVSPGFDCPCCLENYRARRIPPRHLQAEVRALRFRNIAALSGQQDMPCVIASQLPSCIHDNYKRRLHTAGRDGYISPLYCHYAPRYNRYLKRHLILWIIDDKVLCNNFEL